MRDDATAVDVELVLLGLSAENRVVFQHQALHLRTSLADKRQSSSEATDAATNDDALIGFAGIGCVGGRVVGGIAELVAGCNDFPSIAVGVGILTDATVASPIALIRRREHFGLHCQKVSRRVWPHQ